MMLSELRNLSGKNLASYCLALLVAYCAFIAGQVKNFILLRKLILIYLYTYINIIFNSKLYTFVLTSYC